MEPSWKLWLEHLVPDGPGYKTWIVTVPRGSAGRISRRLDSFRRPTEAFYLVEQDPGALGNLGGTVHAWEHVQRHGIRLETPIALVHAAGAGTRAGTWASREMDGRSAIQLPGRVRGVEARLLEVVLHSLSPLAASQPPDHVDVLWVSQIFVPLIHPFSISRPAALLTKFSTAAGGGPSPDLGRFRRDTTGNLTFLPQGTDGEGEEVDLGTFRVHADLLRWWSEHLSGKLDVDPHFTASLGVPDGLVSQAARALGGPVVGTCHLGTGIPWWRLRRPSEIESAILDLRPDVARGAPLRVLLSMPRAITRTWLGERWIESSDLPALEADLRVFSFVDTAVSDCALVRAEARGSVLADVSGQVRVSDAIAIHALDPQTSGGVHDGSAPAPGSDTQILGPVLDFLERRVDPGSVYAHLARLCREGVFQVHPMDPEGDEAADPVQLVRPAGLVVTRGELARWEAAPARGAEALITAFAENFGRPTTSGRRAAGAAAVDLFRRRGLCLPPPSDPLEALARWRADDDPGKVVLGAALRSLDLMNPDMPVEPNRRRAWVRWRSERGRYDGSASGPGFFQVEHPERKTPWGIPLLDLRPPQTPDGRISASDLATWLVGLGARRLGLCGPAAAGKSTLAKEIARLSSATVLAADTRTWPGDGFRYAQLADTREIWLSGPGIYDHARIADDLRHQPGPVVVEGCFTGLDPAVSDQLDLLVAVILDDDRRLAEKYRRDRQPGGRRIDVVADFVHKTFVEGEDGLRDLVPRADLVWDRGTGDVWIRGRAARSTGRLPTHP